MSIFGFVWYLSAQAKIDILDGLGATVFVYAWVGILGSYALLIVSPHTFHDKHGLTYLLGAILMTVANDSGALFIGRWFGRHPLNKVAVAQQDHRGHHRWHDADAPRRGV